MFNEDLQPGANDAQKLAIRQAVAYTIDRQAIADNVYDGTVTPLYSMVPQGLQYATEPFKDEYGACPDVNAAKAELQKAGVKTPVDLEIWYTPSHYGTGSADEYAEIKQPARRQRAVQRDAEVDGVEPVRRGGVHGQVPELPVRLVPRLSGRRRLHGALLREGPLPERPLLEPGDREAARTEQATTNDTERAKAFSQIQKIGAQDVPTIPIWQGRPGGGGPRRSPWRRGHIRPAYLFRSG